MARVRVVVHKTWLVENPPADLDAAIARAIEPYGMIGVRVGDRIELTGGSSFKVKALGPRLTSDADLPRVGTIEHSVGSGDPPTERITVHLEERLNSALLDAPIKQKYERVLQSIAASVEAALSGHAPVVRPAGWWTDVSLGIIVKRCTVPGAKLQDVGGLVATEAGVVFTGKPRGGCRWEDLADIEVIEWRDNQGLRGHVRRCVRLTNRTGEVGEFWVSGRAEPTAVYAIHALLHRTR